ncbi:Uncharacterised protein [Streptococcus pyogenes]|nr:Uncharacterised protein [Streptococcus pyogenes]VHB19059.1 Uncharacterised protein [Streptococcus pyogenes]VHB56907.1 Uncharacterised protein [Streptococcus pyogenes]VHC88757.1 Uncharacterised protein [Streptococcus pyogenes]VHD42131.1 Uncharacterised protein [Streptococcus pyogenes]
MKKIVKFTLVILGLLVIVKGSANFISKSQGIDPGVVHIIK